MADPTDAFDFGKLIDKFMKGIPAMISKSPIGGWMESVLEFLGIKDEADKVVASVQDKAMELSGNKDVVTVRTGLETAVTSNDVYQPITNKYGIPIDGPFMTGLQDVMKANAQAYLKKGIPSDEAAFASTSKQLYKEVYDYAMGSDDNPNSALLTWKKDLTDEECKQKAQEIAFICSGVQENSNVSRLLLDVPKSGAIKLYHDAYVALSDPKRKDGNINANSFVMNIDVSQQPQTAPEQPDPNKKALAGANVTPNTPITPGTDVTHNAPPNVNKAPAPAGGVKSAAPFEMS